MRTLLPVLTLALHTALPAQPFDTRGLPADSDFVFVTNPGTDMKLTQSPTMKVLRQKLNQLASQPTGGKQVKQPINYQQRLRETFGLEPNDPNNWIAIGAKLATGESPDDIVFNGAVILHAKVDRAKLQAFAQAHRITEVSASGQQGWDAMEFLDAFLGTTRKAPVKKGPLPPYVLFVPDNETVVLVRQSEAAVCLTRLRDTTPALKLNDEQAAMVATTGKPCAFVGLNSLTLFDKIVDETGVAKLALAYGEIADDQVWELRLTFATEAQALAAEKRVQDVVDLAPLLLISNTSDDAEGKATRTAAYGLLKRIEPVKAKGHQVAVKGRFDTEKLLGLMDRFLDGMLRESALHASRRAAAKEATPTQATK
jgi:hypothetical protein